MDPLSFTASIIAIIGVSGQVAGAIRKLATARGAPDIVLALNNEITDLHLVVAATQDAFQRQQTISLPLPLTASGYHASIASSLHQILDKVQELEALYDRVKPVTSSASRSLKLNKVLWFRLLREQSKVRRMLDDLKTVRLKLTGALRILNLYAKDLDPRLHVPDWERA